VIFQNVLCLGDSQTSGARTNIGYPEALANMMERRTGVIWNCINAGVPRDTAVEVLRRTQRLVREFSDVFIVCLLAGCNDTRVDRQTPPDTFALIFRQLLNLLRSSRVSGTFVGTIPIIQSGFGTLPYDKVSRALRLEYNSIIEHLCRQFEIPLVDTSMDRSMYVDAIHFNESGCFELAVRFASAIMETTEGIATDTAREGEGTALDRRGGPVVGPTSG
jgi:lysophospholipase L1-like esterase